MNAERARESEGSRDPVLETSRKDALFTAALWLAACAYTVGYAAAFAYRPDPAPEMVLGMPSWVVWGVVAPWTVCTAATIGYAVFGMADVELGPEREADAG